MVNLLWLTAALGAGLLLSDGAVASPGHAESSVTPYRNFDVCPERCSISGPNTGNWSVYPNFKKIGKCQQTMFYDFSLHDPVDDPEVNHRIYACSSFGPDFSRMPPSSDVNSRIAAASAESVDVEFEIGWWREGYGLASSGIQSLVRQIRKYTENGHGASTDKPFIIYGRSGQASIGIYIGQGLLNQGLTESALGILEDNFDNLNVSSPTLAMQLCEPHYDSTHVFGFMATSDRTFAPIQSAIKSWSNATCLSFNDSTKYPGTAKFTTRLLNANNSTSLQTRGIRARADGECSTVQVEGGTGCPELAEKCGISPADFTKYNPGENFCKNLKPNQHVCCSTGDLPDFSPKPNEDGSCKTHLVTGVDNCDSLAAEYSLTKEDLEEFNKNTWGWNGCNPLYKDSIICLSQGTPPFPAPIANAICGPQKPGTKAPTDSETDIADLNPCPLNACCNIWGQCGITKDFCIDTNTGAPGTAKNGTYGCISNCGTDVVKGDGNGDIKIAYYEGYCFSRDCLFQDVSQIDTSAYTHIHFGFGTLTTDYEVETGDALSSYQFSEFKRISGAKKILSFGGWDFSTMPETYKIFREGVTAANRKKMATKIADFIKDNDLDGVDIDWEYPGAPDLPENDPGSPDEGKNYLAFLVVLKNLLPGKSVSIAAPSSYWYLKQYPIEEISKVVDYIVYMTYDLHGQWDAGNDNAFEDCDSGNCLRSQVNLTETKQSLAMITKAGVAGQKVVVGVTSYGRSFKMAEAGCWGPQCQYTGDRLNSEAKKGKCTGTAGYIADAEIAEIMKDESRVVKSFVDSSSNSDILVYDETEWVGYMSAATKKTRTNLYSAWGLGGTSDWASDLQTYHDVPQPATSWGSFIQLAKAGDDPKTDHSRNGNWTEMDCTDPISMDKWDYFPWERWNWLNADAAWDDVVRVWQDTDSKRPGVKFMESVSSTLHIGSKANCGKLVDDSCVSKDCEKGFDSDTSGPAGELIWNSLVQVHMLFKDYHDTLFEVAAITSTALDDFENTFAPIPPEKDNEPILLLIDLLTVGTLTAAGPFFNNLLKKLPYFVAKGSKLDNIKDTTMTLIGQSTTIAKDVLPSDDDSPWTPEKQDSFSNYMGQIVDGWANITSIALKKIFDGTPESLDVLWDAMSEGKLAEGKYGHGTDDGDDNDDDKEEVSENDKNELRANIQKTFYGFAIPAIWRASETYAFILDSGYGCEEDHPASDYLEDDTMDATDACIDNRRYYLVYPDGDSKILESSCVGGDDNCATDRYVRNKFSKPPGLGSLGGKDRNFGGITREDLIKGSVNTWKQNNKQNKDSRPDTSSSGAIDKLLDVDVTAAGIVRLPVCDPERAFQSWDTAKKGSSEFYPCDIPPGKSTCGDSSFVDQTSGASPKIEDCRQIIKNIRGDASTDWTTQVVGKNQREIAHHASCHFGVEATKVNGNVNFVVGGQDVIDIINDTIEKFGNSDGKVGAKGDMKCNGNSKQQNVKWGIY